MAEDHMPRIILQLRDGTLVEVGKSTEAREDLLSRFRAALGLVTLSVVVLALGGGLLATQSATGSVDGAFQISRLTPAYLAVAVCGAAVALVATRTSRGTV
jgi:hypothetical protein